MRYLTERTMHKTNREKVKEAFSLKADLSDQQIRMIRANTMGVSLYEYEKTLKEIGLDDF
tara:strand:+ start:256 stop:435 length:180 start_codon:yes stop_codon:yes gene_type:complete